MIDKYSSYILNLTQHKATADQISAGVSDIVRKDDLKFLHRCLTFEEIPTRHNLVSRAMDLAMLASLYHPEFAMIGGAPYLMPRLEQELRCVGIKPLYAFSKRVSIEETMEDGTVQKVNRFQHLGFVNLNLNEEN